jgi:L-lactate permease
MPVEHFWQILAVSLLAVLVVTAFLAQHDIRQNYNYVVLIIVSKLVTTLGYLSAVIFSGPYFAYVTGMAVDFIILVLTWFCYSRAVGSRVI